MSRPLVAGNWKMNKTVPESIELRGRAIRRALPQLAAGSRFAFSPIRQLWLVHLELEGSDVALGAQDIYWEKAARSPARRADAGGLVPRRTGRAFGAPPLRMLEVYG